MDVFKENGIKYALEVHPTEIAFDIASAKRALEAIDYHPSFGFNYDPSHLGYQGVDYVGFIYKFADRTNHVHMKDVAWSDVPVAAGVFGGHVDASTTAIVSGTSSLLAAETSTSRRSSAPSMMWAMQALFLSSGKTVEWTVRLVLLSLPHSVRRWISLLQTSCLMPSSTVNSSRPVFAPAIRSWGHF